MIDSDYVEYKSPRALDVPKKEKPKRQENDALNDGYEREECGYNWEDQRRKKGGGRVF